jgi:hypothetical protein
MNSMKIPKKKAALNWPPFLLRVGLSRLEQLAALVGSNAHAQRVELDEARRIGLVVSAAIFFEGGDVGVEQ